MAPSMRMLVLASTAILLSPSLAVAKHRHRTIAAAHTSGYAVYDTSPGAIIAAATARAQDEPGVTREISPDARQTASGGPSGGLPNNGGGP